MDIRGIIFDMDGTLTVPVLDFARIRRELNIGENEGDLVTVINRRNAAEQCAAWALIERYEAEAAADCCLQPDVTAVLNRFAGAGIRLGVITRNSRRSAGIVLRRLDVAFDPVLTREFPHMKPSPEPVRHVLDFWELESRKVLMVGDYIHDIASGRDAGVMTCYFHNPSMKSWADAADFTVSSYAELEKLIL